MTSAKSKKSILKIFLGTTLALVLILALALVIGVGLDLSGHRKLVSSIFSKVLNRRVELNGPVEFRLGLDPAVVLNKIAIHNPKGFSDRLFLSADRAELSISLPKLLARKIHVPAMGLEGVQLNLESLKDASANWVFRSSSGKSRGEKKPFPLTPRQIFSLAPDFLDIRDLEISGVNVSYRAWNSTEPVTMSDVSGKGSGRPGEPFDLHFQGKIGGKEFKSNIQAGSLAELLQSKVVWLSVEVLALDSRLAYRGRLALPMVRMTGEMTAEFSGNNLSDLDYFFDLDLPPLKDYSLKSKVLLRGKRIIMDALEVRVGSSSLHGEAVLDRTGDKPYLNSTLKASTVQLNDFKLPGWSAMDKIRVENNTWSVGKAKIGDVRKLFSPESFSLADADVAVYVDQVLSGRDNLGGGELKLSLVDQNLSVRPLVLNIPGGSFFLSSSLDLAGKDIGAGLTIAAHRFDYGVLIRRNKPDSDMAGLMSLDLDLKSRASGFADLMAHADGQISLVVKPYNFKAGIVDMWAVNLLAAVLPKFGQDPSMVNCLLLKLDAQDGIMTPQALLVDTTNIRAAGVGKIDFKTRTVALTIAPEAKKPQLFSLSTPVHVSGKFDDFKISVRPEDILETAIVFLTSPVHVPIRRLFETYLPPDGGDVCNTNVDRPDDAHQRKRAGSQ